MSEQFGCQGVCLHNAGSVYLAARIQSKIEALEKVINWVKPYINEKPTDESIEMLIQMKCDLSALYESKRIIGA